MMKTAVLAAASALLFLGSSSADAASSAPFGPPIEDLRAVGGMGIDRPANDAVVLYSGVEVTLEPDGRITRRVRVVQRLLTDWAIGHLGDPRVAFDTRKQELQVEINRTFMLDGTEVDAKPHAFNLVTPDRLALCPDRTDLQEMVISHVGLERGCLVELLYSVRDREPWRPWLDGIESIGGALPVRSAEVRITVPDLAALKAAVVHADASPPERLADGVTLAYRFGPLEAFPHEGGVEGDAIVPALLYSTCPSWEAAGAWLRGRLADSAAIEPALAAWAENNLDGGRPPLDDRDRVRRVVDLISERTHAADDTPCMLWLVPRAAARTFDTSCGNLLDRAALGWAALRAWGLECSPALVSRTGRFVREVPGLAQVEDLRLVGAFGEISIGSGSFGDPLDPAGGEETLLLGENGIRFGEPAPAFAICRMRTRLHENADGSVVGEISLRASGGARGKAETGDAKAYLESLADATCPGAALAGYRMDRWGSDSLDCILSFTAPRLGASLGGGRCRLTIPNPPGFDSSVLPAGLSLDRQTRRTPIHFPRLAVEDLELRLELAPGTRVLTAPPTQSVAGGGASIVAETSGEGATWIFRRRFETTRREVAASDYGVLREVLLRRVEEGSTTVLLAR